MIQLTKSGNAILFTFDENDHYLYNGTIEVPVNSLSLVTDSSEMFTFKKSATNDIFVSGLYSEIGMTKSELETFYKENMVGGGITSGEVQSMIDESISGKADTSAVTESINAAVSGKADTSAVTQSITEATSGLQVTLVSGTNIKTINNESILGSGNITISGGTGGNPTVELTQAEYDALVSAGTVDNHTYYIITDATPIDISNYYTSAQTESAINSATSGKVDASSVVSAVTSASTDSQIPTAKAVYDAIPTGGTSITIDPSLDSGSTNPVANSAVSAALNYSNRFLYRVESVKSWDNHPTGEIQLRWRNPYNGSTGTTQVVFTLMKINNIPLIADYVSGIYNLNLVEASAITTSISSSSTDAQVPSAKAVHDQLGGMKIVKLTESEYTALVTKDSNTLYCVVPDPSN